MPGLWATDSKRLADTRMGSLLSLGTFTAVLYSFWWWQGLTE